jgi:hypothetical protein
MPVVPPLYVHFRRDELPGAGPGGGNVKNVGGPKRPFQPFRGKGAGGILNAILDETGAAIRDETNEFITEDV